MLSRLRSRAGAPSPATVIALIALVVALGGVTYAAIPSGNGTISGCYSTATGTLRVIDAAGDAECAAGEKAISWKTGESIGSDDIADFQVRGVDLATGSVGRNKIAAGAVNGSKVADNSLTGADVLESSLGKVAEANLLDGKDSSAFGGPTQGYEFTAVTPAKIGGAFTNVVTSGELPAGAYQVVARVEAVNANGGSDPIACRIQTLPDTLLRDVTGHNYLSHYQLTLIATFATLLPGSIGVDCNGTEGAQATAKLVVVRIDSAG
jgi:hypothetical protein